MHNIIDVAQQGSFFFSTKEQENAVPTHTSDWTENNFSKPIYFES